MNKNKTYFKWQAGRFFFVLLALAVLLPAHAMADEVKVSLSLKNVGLPTILKEIKAQTGYDFMYNAQEIDTEKKISVELNQVALDSALQVCLSPYNLTYTMRGKIIVLQKAIKVIQSMLQSTINGIVKDEKGVFLPGVAVILDGTSMGTATDMEGRFKLTIPSGKHKLNFSFYSVIMLDVCNKI